MFESSVLYNMNRLTLKMSAKVMNPFDIYFFNKLEIYFTFITQNKLTGS